MGSCKRASDVGVNAGNGTRIMKKLPAAFASKSSKQPLMAPSPGGFSLKGAEIQRSDRWFLIRYFSLASEVTRLVAGILPGPGDENLIRTSGSGSGSTAVLWPREETILRLTATMLTCPVPSHRDQQREPGKRGYYCSFSEGLRV